MSRRYNDSVLSRRRAIQPLKVIVVGAGIGGLAIGLCMQKTGHDVVILEMKEEITEIGAGIQLAPNAARILRRFGVLEEVMNYATVLVGISSRRWENDEELGSVPLIPHVEEQFGAPLAVIHRADLQRVLLDAARACGCTILTDHKVLEVDQEFLPRVLVRRNGIETCISGDLVIAADGMNSPIRKQMASASGHIDHLAPAGQLAYRFLLPKELVERDETVMSLLRQNRGMRYMGPGGHVMAYPLRNNTLYNVVLVRENAGVTPRTTCWTTPGRKEEIIEHHRGWSPSIQALIRHVPSSAVLETPMCAMPPLPTWVKGRVALAGDSCHYMLPYVAQGAATAIEDAGTLAMAFTCTNNIDLALKMYELVRKQRSERIQASATSTGNTLHMPDGAEQIRRDDAIRAASRGTGSNPDQWNDRESREFMWGVDVMAETINRFEALATMPQVRL